MLDQALEARLPMVQVRTDDIVNIGKVLRHMVHKDRSVVHLENLQIGSGVYWTTDGEKWGTADMLAKAAKGGATIVLVNCEPNPYAFDAGLLAVPDKLMHDFLSELVSDPDGTEMPKLEPLMRGLSLKVAGEVLMLTEARTGGLTPHEVRRTRAMLAPSSQGLSLMDTTLDFYDWPPGLKDWLDLNEPYFHGAAHSRLVPRGLLFDGPPGTGKSTAAKAIAERLGVPLYRLDIAATLDKYIGVSESRLLQSLALVDREAPCVLLIDEVEKIFGEQTGDSGVTARMLSSLLWWLAEHQSKVFTVMTTNDKDALPPELHREGRIDKTIQLGNLGLKDALSFGRSVLLAVLESTTPTQLAQAREEVMADFPASGRTHADVAERIYNLIKRQGWGLDKSSTKAHATAH